MSVKNCFLYHAFNLDFSVCLHFGRSISPNLKAQNVYSYQCPFSISSYCLSFPIVIFIAFITSWSGFMTLVQATRITSYMNETILYFPFSSQCSYTVSSEKTLLAKFIMFSWYLLIICTISSDYSFT